MKIHLQQIPAGGAHIEGEEDCPIPELDKDEVQCAGPLRYSLEVGTSADGLWANGSLRQPVTLRCVSCLTSFEHTIEVPNFAVHIELGGPETIDLTPFAREDILLNLPSYPHCDKHGGRTCVAAPVTADDGSEAIQAQRKREADWGALDKLKL